MASYIYIATVGKYYIVKHLRHFLPGNLLFYFIGRQVLCRKCLKCLTIQYWTTVEVQKNVPPYIVSSDLTKSSGTQHNLESYSTDVVNVWLIHTIIPPFSARCLDESLRTMTPPGPSLPSLDFYPPPGRIGRTQLNKSQPKVNKSTGAPY